MAERERAGEDEAGGSWAVDATALTYGLALGAGTLLLPLIAVDAGYSPSEVGLLTGVSAVAQIAFRLVLGAAMRRYADRTLVTAAGMFLTLSLVSIGLSSALAPFVLAEALQGASRACFWTGVQTHVVRGEAAIVRRLARVNLVGNIGLLAGPIGAGFLIERSTGAAVAAGSALAGGASVLSLGMRRLPPFVTDDLPVRSPLWRRPGVAIGSVSVGVAGSWRGFISSYAPVVLGQGGHAASTIGILIAVANASSTISAGLLARIPVRNTSRVIAAASLAVAGGSGLIGFVASSGALAGACLLAGGLGAGGLQILGSAVASEVVHEEERGDAIAVTGTFRAVALFASPAGIAGLLQVMALAPALGVTGLVLATPALLARRTPT